MLDDADKDSLTRILGVLAAMTQSDTRTTSSTVCAQRDQDEAMNEEALAQDYLVATWRPTRN